MTGKLVTGVFRGLLLAATVGYVAAGQSSFAPVRGGLGTRVSEIHGPYPSGKVQVPAKTLFSAFAGDVAIRGCVLR